MCSLAGHLQLLLLEADPMAKCLKFPGNFQTKFIHNTFLPICSRTKMIFPLKWVFSLLRFKSSLCLSRAVFQHERYQKRRNIFTKWHLRESGCRALEFIVCRCCDPTVVFLGLLCSAKWPQAALCMVASHPCAIPEGSLFS